MNKFFSRKKAAILALAVPVAMGLPVQVLAQDGEIEEVIITGTRVADRSAADSTVPVDVISGADFRDTGSTDIQDMLRTAVPSYDVNAQPISDAASIIRPANLRGLSPDNTLVLVNGPARGPPGAGDRPARHRAAGRRGPRCRGDEFTGRVPHIQCVDQ